MILHALAAASLLGMITAPVPKALLGTWVHGSCARPTEKLFITRRTAKLGNARPAAIVYTPSGDGGRGTIHWRAQFSADDFVYMPEHNHLLHNNYPEQVVFGRCSTF